MKGWGYSSDEDERESIRGDFIYLTGLLGNMIKDGIITPQDRVVDGKE